MTLCLDAHNLRGAFAPSFLVKVGSVLERALFLKRDHIRPIPSAFLRASAAKGHRHEDDYRYGYSHALLPLYAEQLIETFSIARSTPYSSEKQVICRRLSVHNLTLWGPVGMSSP